MRFLDNIRAQTPASTRALDPICGMTIDPARAAGTSEHEGRTVHFCSSRCKQAFDAAPARYADRLRGP